MEGCVEPPDEISVDVVCSFERYLVPSELVFEVLLVASNVVGSDACLKVGIVIGPSLVVQRLSFVQPAIGFRLHPLGAKLYDMVIRVHRIERFRWEI